MPGVFVVCGCACVSRRAFASVHDCVCLLACGMCVYGGRLIIDASTVESQALINRIFYSESKGVKNRYEIQQS